MDRQSVLGEIGSWPVEGRLRLMEEIWESILDPRAELETTEAQKAELTRRLAEDDASPDEVVTWGEVKAAALKRAVR